MDTTLAKPIAVSALPDRVNEAFSTLRIVSGLSGGGGAGVSPGRVLGDGRKREAQTDQKKTDRNEGVENDRRKGATALAERADPSEGRESAERSNSGLKTEKVEKVERVEKVEKIERPERVERVEKIEKVEKVEKVERPERSSRG